MLRKAKSPLRARIAGYVALTKPRIIELLLITTVPTMVVARSSIRTSRSGAADTPLWFSTRKLEGLRSTMR